MADWKFSVIEYMTELHSLGKTEEIDDIRFSLEIFGYEATGMMLEGEGVI